MSDGIVIDANIIPLFSQELRIDEGIIYGIVYFLLNGCGLAIDDFIASEWEGVCKDVWFNEWYTDELKNGRIRKIESKKIDNHIKKRMRIEYGFPTKTMDIKYIECAYGTKTTKYVMTLNYHFFDPKCIGQSIQYRKRARENREGAFCKHVLRVLGVRIGMPEHCILDFGIC